MLNVALTGNIASGKSAVARLFAEWGALVIDADEIVRELQRPGTETFRAIVAEFGSEVVAASGALDRSALRARVFNDDDARQRLNRIVHPAVAAERERQLARARERGTRIVVSDIPLLFETTDPKSFDAVVLVDAPIETRRARLLHNRSLDPTTADRMIAAQIPAAAKRHRSTFVIDNDGDLDQLARRARAVWDELLARQIP